MQGPIENKQSTMVGHSGNSDVDLVVNVDIDTKAIAYGMLCSIYAKGELSEQELEKAIQKLDEIIDKDKSKKKSYNDPIIINNRNLFNNSSERRRRSWI